MKNILRCLIRNGLKNMIIVKMIIMYCCNEILVMVMLVVVMRVEVVR